MIRKKKNNNIKWFKNSKIFINEKLILTVGSTKSKIFKELWAGNHSFFTKLKISSNIKGVVKNFSTKYKFKI